jgi:hypothetical protein
MDFYGKVESQKKITTIVTEKQIGRVRIKIKRIRGVLAAEKRRFGAYDDSRGLRYMPPALYLQIGDYSGAMIYLRWYEKNFEDDIRFPDFLFEWTLILFMNQRFKEAERKAFETFCSNTYLFDKFFNKGIVPALKYESCNVNKPEFTENLNYSSTQPELSDFARWLSAVINAERFTEASAKFVNVQKRLYSEDDHETRGYLLQLSRQIRENY